MHGEKGFDLEYFARVYVFVGLFLLIAGLIIFTLANAHASPNFSIMGILMV